MDEWGMPMMRAKAHSSSRTERTPLSGAVVDAFRKASLTSSDAVAHDVQGRVLAAKNMVQVASMPLGYLAASLLADRVFEPAMAAGCRLAGVFGPLVGTGPGAGMGLMFACTCVLGLATGLSGFLFPAIRHIEDEAGGAAQPAVS